MNFVEKILDIFLVYRRKREQRKLEIINKFNNLSIQCYKGNSKYNELVKENRYINYLMKENWIRSYNTLFEKVVRLSPPKKISIDEVIIKEIDDFKVNYKNFEAMYLQHNKSFVEKEKKAYKHLFDNVEGRALDEQQRECVVKDEINNLVIAGAGSGKTTTIVGKVKFLISRYNYSPSELLILSFTNNSATEMRERIEKETGKHIDVMTFHSLGRGIIEKVEGKPPKLVKDKELTKLINDKFDDLSKDRVYQSLLNNYFTYYMKEYKSNFEFKTFAEYKAYLEDAQIETFQGEQVKSFEEMEIANFLFVNQIEYDYEKDYEHDTRTKEYGQYAPDFYLPQYGIYIEHFGINRQGKVPPFFSGGHGKSAQKLYEDKMEWARELHKKYDTTLIETFSYEKSEGKLLINLEKKLKQKGVKFNPLNEQQIWEKIKESRAVNLKSFKKLINNFINMVRTNDYKLAELYKKNDTYYSGFKRSRNKAFLKLIDPIYSQYVKMLKDADRIDFSDMINKAKPYVIEGKFNKSYKYIIVDEYQDISKPRYELIKAIKDKNDSKIFCVGDDWQAIYRFSGSDINLFTRFEKLFGFTETSYIETTYRFPKSVIDLSGKFILKNKNQIAKNLKSINGNDDKAFDLLYGENQKDLNEQLKKTLNQLPDNSEVVLLGRYNMDLDGYLDDEILNHPLRYSKRPDIKLKFMTAHGSKGLQGDYVFILNNKNGRFGFPSNIVDDLVMELVLQDKEPFPYAEERRLFYVALTRCKKFVYMMVDEKHKSTFIKEIEKDYKIVREKDKKKTSKICPRCSRGELLIRTGPYGEFIACERFPKCEYTDSL